MRRSELNQVFNDFKSAHTQLSSLLLGRVSDEAEFEKTKSTFDELLKQVTENLDLFHDEQKEFIRGSSSLAFRHRVRVARQRSQSFSHSRDNSSASLPSESSFNSTSSQQTMNPAGKETGADGDGAKKVSDGDSAQRTRMLQLRFESEDAWDALADEQRQLERKHREKRRELMLKAQAEGFSVDLLAPPPPSLNMSGASQGLDPLGGPSTVAAAAAAPTPSVDHLLHLLGSQKLKNSKPAEAERFGGGAEDYAQFQVKFKSEVLDVDGVTDADRFVALQERTKDEAKRVVNNFVYLEDKSEALTKALEALKFYFEKRTGRSQAKLAKILEGKDVNPNSLDAVKGLLQEIEEMSAFSKAMNEASFLELEATVLSISRKRFGTNMKRKFSQAARQAMKKGDAVNVDFIVAFLKEWFESLNHTYGMAALMDSKPTSSSSSSSPSPPSSSSSKAGKSPANKTNIAVVEASGPQKKPNRQQQRAQPQQQKAPVQQQSTTGCFYCGEAHSIEDCWPFNQISVEERVNAMFKYRRCFKCFQGNHRAADCSEAVQCRFCDRTNHHSLLHSDHPAAGRQQRSTPASSASVAATDSRLAPDAAAFYPSGDSSINQRLISLSNATDNTQRQVNVSAIAATENKDEASLRPVLAVKVVFSNGRSANVYALMDTGSNKTCVTKSFKKRFHLATQQEQVTINALGATSSGLRDLGMVSLTSLVNPDFTVNGVEVLVVDSLPIDPSQIPRQVDVDNYEHLEGVNLIELPEEEVDILIGTDLSHCFAPEIVKKPLHRGPICLFTPLGWCYMGPASGHSGQSTWVALTSVTSEEGRHLDEQLHKMFRRDFPESPSEKKALSQEDMRAEEILKETCQFVNGRFQTGLLWKYDRKTTASILPTAASETTARVRTRKLLQRLRKTPKLKEQVEERIENLIRLGYAEKVDMSAPTSDIVWYLPGVVVEEEHKDRPRFCLDCKAESKGVSLNSVLLTGADSVTSVFAALQNCRLFDYFAAGDAQDFFHRVKIPPEDMDVFRFFRWVPGDEDKLECLRMNCNIFGSKCSSSNSTYALRENAAVHGKDSPPEVIKAIYNAYVDDIPSTAPSHDELISLNQGLIDLCKKGDFIVTKFISNSRPLLSSLPEELRAKGFKDPEAQLPSTSVLGLKYEPEMDTFCVKVPSKSGGGSVENRKQVLSAVMGLFDPLGIISPFILLGKKFNQRLCGMKLDWSEPLPPEIASEITRWLEQISGIEKLSIPRSLSLPGPTASCTLHTFVDATPLIGYACVSYFVIDGSSDVKFIASRARVSPIKETNVDVNGSTPRVELQAAVTGTELATQISEEMNVEISRKVFHTDSTCVYWWLHNKEEKYPVFVANRINKVLLVSSPDDWRWVPTASNPADVGSRGAMPDDDESWRLFYNGPEFLRGPEEDWPPLPLRLDAAVGVILADDQQESVVQIDSFVDTLLRRKSDFNSVKRIVIHVSRFIAKLKERAKRASPLCTPTSHPSPSEFQEAEKLMVKDVQRRHFGPEVDALRDALQDPRKLKRVFNRSASSLRQIDPFLDNEGVLRVGGRLKQNDEPFEVRHPIILPYDDPFTNHVISHIHEVNGHCGLEFTFTTSRRQYWILRGRQNCKKVLWRCLTCRRIHRRPEDQKMADLPYYRLNIAEVFADTGVDLIGPLTVKSGRKGMKVWIVLFCCLRVRAIYLDLVKSLESKEFIEILQRFHAFYPTLRRLVSDQGTNLMGARNVLAKMGEEWAADVCHFLAPLGVKWDVIPAHASHAGGSWERLVGLVKRVLHSMVHGEMHYEQLRTLIIVAAGITNRRPLVRSSVDVADLSALTPMHFILPSKMVSSSDVLPAVPLSGTQLRRAHDELRPLLDSFWKRFKHEYVPHLQRRTKWLSRRRNLAKGDLVLVVDELFPREKWPLARIVEVYPSADGLVRRVRVITSTKRELERDVRKIVLLEREGEGDTAEDIGDGGGGDDGDGGDGD